MLLVLYLVHARLAFSFFLKLSLLLFYNQRTRWTKEKLIRRCRPRIITMRATVVVKAAIKMVVIRHFLLPPLPPSRSNVQRHDMAFAVAIRTLWHFFRNEPPANNNFTILTPFQIPRPIFQKKKKEEDWGKNLPRYLQCHPRERCNRCSNIYGHLL